MSAPEQGPEKGSAGDTPSGRHTTSLAPSGPGTGRPHLVGSGWTAVAVLKTPAAAGADSKSLDTLTRALPRVSGSWGSGHVLRGTLFSAVLTDDGRVAVGAVAPERLYAALAGR